MGTGLPSWGASCWPLQGPLSCVSGSPSGDCSVAWLAHLLASKGVRLAERSCDLGASTPDREQNLEDGVRRLTKVQHGRSLMPLELSRHTTIARALDDSTTHR
jgi:hypothetical protein